jgi:hypothetical protein
LSRIVWTTFSMTSRERSALYRSMSRMMRSNRERLRI